MGIHWIALTKYFQMSTHLPGFQSYFRFLGFLHDFVFVKLGTSSIRVKMLYFLSGNEPLEVNYLLSDLLGIRRRVIIRNAILSGSGQLVTSLFIIRYS